MHFAHNYIGEEWVAGQNDCYSFIKKIWHNHYSIDNLPHAVKGDDGIENRRAFMAINHRYFVSIDKRVDGCAVVMKQGKYPAHVGIWLEELQGILHCIEKAGVIFTKPEHLHTLGFEIYQYYVVKIQDKILP